MIELTFRKNEKNNLYAVTEDVFGYILEKIESNIEPLRGKFPDMSKNGVWETTENTSDDFWTLGFWPGMLGLAYMETKNRRYEKMAYKWMRLIEHRKNDRDHDLGFVFFPSFVKGYELTGDVYLRDVALDAADSLLSLFNPQSNFIQTRPEERGIAAIDTMMNLFLLWWVYEETKDKRYYDAAFCHSAATMKNMVGEDGSTIEKDRTKAERYEKTACKISESLTKNYLTKGKNELGILMHGCFDKPCGLGVDSCTIFGDYYYMEELTKLLDLKSK